MQRQPTPKLSIIIATWNAAKTLERCLESITTQTFPSWELLIRDGGSTDATLSIIEKYQSAVAWWESAPDNGIYDAWNLALKHAKGEYVCFLGADDWWLAPDSLEKLFAAMSGSQFDLVTSRGLMTDSSTGRTMIFGSPWNYIRLGRRMVVCHPGLLHRRSLFENFGAFDTRFRIAGDLEFLLRLPRQIKTLDVDRLSVGIELGGISRANTLARLAEQRTVLSRCPRYGPFRAWLVWLDKLWRYPIARILRISH